MAFVTTGSASVYSLDENIFFSLPFLFHFFSVFILHLHCSVHTHGFVWEGGGVGGWGGNQHPAIFSFWIL